MELSHEQLTTLKADIYSDPTLAAWAATGRMAQEIADAYNVIIPEFVVWKTMVQPDEWRAAIVGGGGATQLDALTASKRDALLWAVEGPLNPANPVIRAALDDFCGSQNNLKAAIVAVQKRSATRAEKLYAVGTGSVASPATMVVEGMMTYQNIDAALLS